MTDINLPDAPAMPESMEPPAVAGGPSDEELFSLDQLRDAWDAQADAANCWDALGIDEIVCWAQKQALARWGCPATPPAVTTRALLHPAYEPGDGSADGAQIVDLEWWHPVMGCDSLQVVVDNFRAALAVLARWGNRQAILDSSIAPPPELVEEWIAQVWHEGTPVRVAASELHVATQAARWGAAHALPIPAEGE